MVNYLDHCFLISSDFATARGHQIDLNNLLHPLRYYISFKKMKSLSTKITFLGIYIDSIMLEMTLLQDKLDKLHTWLCKLDNRTKATGEKLKNWEDYWHTLLRSLGGGGTFSYIVYDLMPSVEQPYYKARLSAGFRENIQWWINLSQRFNGKALILGRFADFKSLYTDVSTRHGAVYDMDWFVGFFPGGVDKHTKRGHHLDLADSQMIKSHIDAPDMWAVYVAVQDGRVLLSCLYT